jgi:hypothetical protein
VSTPEYLCEYSQYPAERLPQLERRRANPAVAHLHAPGLGLTPLSHICTSACTWTWAHPAAAPAPGTAAAVRRSAAAASLSSATDRPCRSTCGVRSAG